MPRKSQSGDEPSRYLTFAEVARELQVSVESVRDKALAGRDLTAVDVGNGTERHQWRVTRQSFEDYCARIERESTARFGRAS